MGCPLYVDFTRMCLEKFPTLVKFSTLQTCESEQYANCPIHQVYNCNFYCEYFYDCANQYIEKMPKVLMTVYTNKDAAEVAKDIWTMYCLSPEHSKICAKYQLRSKGEIPPLNLMPDGSKISAFDLLFRRKLIVRPPE
jgi:hypothetical protein